MINKKEDFRRIEDFDWRLQAITTISKESVSPYGTVLKKGEPIVKVHPVKINDKSTVIYTPNATAMFLNLSYKFYNQAIKIFNLSTLLQKKSQNEKRCFNSIEYYMASIIFAYTSLESFTNECIPDSYIYKKKIKGVLKTFNRDKIQRKISLQEKMKFILSKIKKVNFNEENPLWADYQSLKNIRNRIIHMKTIDILYNRKDNFYDTIWNEILNNGKPINYSKVAKEVIKFFLKNKKPRWFLNCIF
ncbi:hypothetical protein ES705_00644 [subsurface metagenome]|nr:hypothetical protein [Clostridia bacterium]